ncbi:uncharacterized protein LOC101862415 [Aplysia californica]|uniref:Uncharacterized protein LOC101862415 n=1 Tax=Aplysia californica TaxID=6500 RepID=A0ABM0JQ57_APLCA|nr:uncharacterized protein LOC101862415 [Aplysia californica]
MAYFHDTELLILEIRKRPVIWNCSLDDYKNKIKKNDAWAGVCRALQPNFDAQDDVTKKQTILEIKARWKSIRDTYTRSQKKIQRKSGSGATKTRKYMFADHLAFLRMAPSSRATEDSLDFVSIVSRDQSPDGHKVEQVDEEHEGLASESQSPSPAPSCGSVGPQSKSRKRKLEEKMLTFIDKCDKPDDDREFFSSLLPAVKKLNEDQKLTFRVDVIRALQAAKAGGQSGSTQM